MELVISDGGRSKYFQKANVKDCVTRAICNATGMDYKKVYDDLNELAKNERTGCRKRKISNARNGVYRTTWEKYLFSLGFKKTTCVTIGSKERVHLNSNELPKDKTLIVNVSKHLTCVKNGVLYDTYDCSRNGNRMVYSYYFK